ncbi:MAG: 2-oxoacid:acceptor oxidoreductase family protein [Candidatus Omnitrophota bacterium]
MVEKIIIAGAGGQGIMLLGKVIAKAALEKKLNVTWFPAYGAEVRGGAAYCMVVISSSDIPSPYIDKADTLIIMNELSLSKFKQKIKSKGLLLINSSLVSNSGIKHKISNIEQINLPITEAAVKLGNIKTANMVALGAYIAKKDIFSKENIFTAIEEIAPSEKNNLVEINKQAIEEGIKLLLNHYADDKG